MIALMMMGAVVLYIAILFIALWLIPKAIKVKHIKKMIFIVWFLIPTWDVIIGYPIYKFLCATQAGVKIYKTVDNVEGFYIGEQRKEFEPYEPYAGYKYVDYKEMDFFKPTGKKYGTYWTGKYYRSYWVDNNTSELCVHYGEQKFGAYADAYRSGKCIVKEEIAESEVSRWKLDSYSIERQKRVLAIPLLDFTHQTPLLIQDTKNGQTLGQLDYYWWSGGWLFRRFSSFSSGSGGVICGDDTSEITFFNTTLKPTLGVLHGNN
jgi:hypothetical protein